MSVYEKSFKMGWQDDSIDKGAAAQADDLSLIPRTHTSREPIHASILISTCAWVYIHNKKLKVFIMKYLLMQ